MRRTAFVALVATFIGLVAGPVQASSSASSAQPPEIISLPNGFQPEGIANGFGSVFFAGSLLNGAIVRGDLRTGQRRVFIPGVEGRVAVGMEVDSANRLWVAGGPTGKARVYDAHSGTLLRTYTFAPANSVFLNDVVVTDKAAYFTDSFSSRLFVVPIGYGGHLGSFRVLHLTGVDSVPGEFNLNGIEASSTGRTLLVVQSNKGLLFRVNASTGVARVVRTGADLTGGDGLLRDGRTLFVVRGSVNAVAQLRLGDGFRTARQIALLRDRDLDTPSTTAKLGRFLFVVNARFNSVATPTPQTRYWIARVTIDD